MISLSDPLLLRIVRYLDPSVQATATFSDVFTGSTRELFAAFASTSGTAAAGGCTCGAVANLEAFSTRNAPCLPVDAVGNAMAELLDRTAKHRLDWSDHAGARSLTM